MNEESLFHLALQQLDAVTRAAFLDQACANQPELRVRLEKLLQAHDAPAGLFDKPAIEICDTVDDPVSERPGTVLGPYKLLEQIGEGGFGIVFMAEQTQPVRRKVALKVLKPGMDTRQIVARFEAERQALALMDHPNIAHVFDGGETAPGRPYFVMELVHGIPITEFCDQSLLSIRERLELFVDVCQALQHAHQKGIIHRDLKPSNVMVTLHDGTPVVKVIDFGIAKATGQRLTEKTLFTNFAQMVGTPLYMSPEQAGLSGLDVDTRSDIYSLGVLLYELLTGTIPFDKERLKEVGYDEMRRIIREEEPPKPSTRISTLGQAVTTVSMQRQSDPKRLNQLLRGELDWIVMQCLEKNRNRRYESASGLARDIERYLHDEPVQACPPSVMYRLRKFARRNKAALVTAVFLAVMMLAALATMAVSNVRIASKQDELDRANRELEANVYFYRVALAERELAVNQAGRAEELLNLCRHERRGWEWHFLKRRIHEEPLLLTQGTVGSGVFGLAWSPDGKVLAAGCWDGRVRLWEPTTGKLLRTFTGQPRGFHGVAFSADSRQLAAANWDGTVTLCDLSANRQRVLKGPYKQAFAVDFSPDGRYLATGGDRTAIVWDLWTDQKMVLPGHEREINRVVYSPDGVRLATASDDETVRLWDAATGQPLLTLREHQRAVTNVAFSPDGRSLASVSRDRTVRLWDATTGTESRVFSGHTGEVEAVAFSPDGRCLASGGHDTTVRLWDRATGQEILTLRDHKGVVTCLAFSPDGQRLASGSYGNLDFSVRVWNGAPVDNAGANPLSIWAGHTRAVTCLAFSPDGSLLASGSQDSTVRVRDTASGEVVQTFNAGQMNGIASVAFSPDGTCLAADGDKGAVNAWRLRTGEDVWGRPRNLSGYNLLGLAYSPDGRFLAVADDGGKAIRILDAATGKELAVLSNEQNPSCVAYHPDGQRLAAAYKTDRSVRIWDLSIQKDVQTLPGHQAMVTGVAYRSDGRYLASAGADGLVIIWDAIAVQEVKVSRRIHAHRDVVNSVAFGPDGRRLATASRDGTVKLWDATTGELLCLLRAHRPEVFAVAFHPDGRHLASTGADGTVKIWAVPR